MMAYQTRLRARRNPFTGEWRYYQTMIDGNGKSYWQRISHVWYQELMAKHDRRYTDHYTDSNGVGYDEYQLFFEVSPV